MAQKTRLTLHDELLKLVDNAYFQPPANIQLRFPCIIYHRDGRNVTHANDDIYLKKTGYQITVVSRDPDSPLPDEVIDHFKKAIITSEFTKDGLYHAVISLYY